MKDYVLSFIIGSSILSYVLWVLSLLRVKKSYYNFNGYLYLMILPIVTGFMTSFSLYLTRKFNGTLFQRLIFTSIIASLTAIFCVYYFKLYNWDNEKHKNKKYVYPFLSFIAHFINYGFIFYVLEKQFIKL